MTQRIKGSQESDYQKHKLSETFFPGALGAKIFSGYRLNL